MPAAAAAILLPLLLLSLLSAPLPAAAIDPFDRHAVFAHRHREQRARLEKEPAAAQAAAAASIDTAHGVYFEGNPSPLRYPGIVEATFTQPLDHFDATTNITFEQRYWYSLRHYLPPSKRPDGRPAPIFVLEGGETSGSDRLKYLDHGILDVMTRAHGGIGVVLEHRYYGQSYPPLSAFGHNDTWTADELQWLTNRQAAQDSATFVSNVAFQGVDPHDNLTAPHAPVIVLGGSYAGARAAHLRVLYDDLFYGAIASSAVTAALVEFPQYNYPVARGNDPAAIQALQAAVAALDQILAPEPHKGRFQTKTDPAQLQALYALLHLEGLSDPADLADLLASPIGNYQATNWDYQESPGAWNNFAAFMSAMANGPPPAELASLRAEATTLGLAWLPDEALRLIHFIRNDHVDACRYDNGLQTTFSADECFARDWEQFALNPKLTSGKAWTYQVCTEWGYFITTPKPSHTNGNPHSPHTFHAIGGPKLQSSLLDLSFTSERCRMGFAARSALSPPASSTSSDLGAEHHRRPSTGIPRHPNVDIVNSLGGFSLTAPRLAFVDGQFDPWRPATPHSEEFAFGGARANTLERPFILVKNGTHHWDENSRPEGQKEPSEIHRVHDELVRSVGKWLDDWEKEKPRVA